MNIKHKRSQTPFKTPMASGFEKCVVFQSWLGTCHCSAECLAQTRITPWSSRCTCAGREVGGVVRLLNLWNLDEQKMNQNYQQKNSKRPDFSLCISLNIHLLRPGFLWSSSEVPRLFLLLLKDGVDEVTVEVEKEDIVVSAVIQLLSIDRMIFCMHCMISFITLCISKLIL